MGYVVRKRNNSLLSAICNWLYDHLAMGYDRYQGYMID